jgi:hypothetical protein
VCLALQFFPACIDQLAWLRKLHGQLKQLKVSGLQVHN